MTTYQAEIEYKCEGPFYVLKAGNSGKGSVTLGGIITLILQSFAWKWVPLIKVNMLRINVHES